MPTVLGGTGSASVLWKHWRSQCHPDMGPHFSVGEDLVAAASVTPPAAGGKISFAPAFASVGRHWRLASVSALGGTGSASV